MPVNEIIGWSATELARRIAAREISARAVCHAHIARCEQLQPQLNALVWTRYEAALQEAAAIDERLARGEQLGPLAGVPFSVKECFAVRQAPACIGLSALQAERSEETASLVHQLQHAGGVLLGKTNVPQLMLWHECDNPVYGRTNNPWDERRTCGGSTGGEAALIGGHGSPLGLGTDMGGSIRVPAAWCGVCGLMPTARRLPSSGTRQNFNWLEAITLVPGPLARSVADLDLAMRVMTAEPQAMTPRQRTDHRAGVPPLAWPDYRAVDIRKLRIAVGTFPGRCHLSPAVARALREAAAALRTAGATLIEDVPLLSDMRTYLGLITADGGACLREMARGSTLDWRASRIIWLAGLGGWSRAMLVGALRCLGQSQLAEMVSSGGPLGTRAFGELIRAQQQVKYDTLAEWDRLELDAVLIPPHELPAPQHGQPIDLVPAAEPAYFANLLGWPAGVVPVTNVRKDEQNGRPVSRDRVLQAAAAVDAGSAGLPVGVQVLGRPWREDVVLATLAAIESQVGFRSLEFPQPATVTTPDKKRALSG